MNQTYQQNEWDEYAQAHLAVMTSFQLEVYKDVSCKMKGNVADFGCGTAKIAPFLTDKAFVKSYTGIDYAPEMVSQAQRLLNQLQTSHYQIKQNKIENIVDTSFDSGLSINSYYSWDEPEQILAHINKLLKPSAPFILVTPNKTLDMEKLLKETDKELCSHPGYAKFRATNMELAGNENALFLDMDELIGQARNAGFKVISCHQDYFMGGLNFLHLKNN